MPKQKTVYVVLESYTDQDGEACAEVLYAGSSRKAAAGAVKAFEGQDAYHEGWAQVAVQSYPDPQDADEMPYAVLEERGHKLFWTVKVA